MPSARLIPPQFRSSLLMLTACAIIAAASVAALSLTWPGHALHLPAPVTFAGTSSTSAVTDICIGPEVLHRGVTRFGINLSGQTFYDSGQMLNNLVFRNPGFEGETWQSNLHCKSVTADSCTDETAWSAWPDHFLDGARFEILTGSAAGSSGTVRSSSAASAGHGVTLTFADPPRALAPGDFLQVRMEKPGDAQAGWWTATSAGATLATEYQDLSPDTPGRQALRIDASGPGQSANVSSFFDSTDDRSFLQLRGRFALHFRAKYLTGDKKLGVGITRAAHTFLQKDVALTPAWHNYTFDFAANEDGSSVGTVGLTFRADHSTILLDDVELIRSDHSPANPTAFRDEVVDTLRDLNPGIVRFMDNGTSFGSTLDDLLEPPFARRRSGSLLASNRSEDIPIGLHESLVLAQAVHADPWYTLPATTSPQEAAHLLEYLAGPASSAYGAKRVALGQPAPWTSVFHTIHLEFGNEMWGNSPGANIADPTAYALRANAIFAAARASAWFNAASFDLIGDAQAPNTWWTGQTLKTATQQTSIDFAPYLFGSLNDHSSTEAIFGPMLAEPEQLDTFGYMAEQATLARRAPHPVQPAIYEVNLGTGSSSSHSITQTQIDSTVASLGAALAVADHMLLMLRELGITTQCLFALPEYKNAFTAPAGTRNTPLWGSVIDMGGPTNLRRPTYYALELANHALLTNELTLHLTGANPTWSQPASSNSDVPASRPHLLQTFAFADGDRRSLILLNLSRTSSLPVTLSGSNLPTGTVSESRLTAAHITDTNEVEAKVVIVRHQVTSFAAAQPYSLPPFSMTVLEWQTHDRQSQP